MISLVDQKEEEINLDNERDTSAKFEINNPIRASFPSATERSWFTPMKGRVGAIYAR